jgi:hypothetical protein
MKFCGLNLAAEIRAGFKSACLRNALILFEGQAV